MTEQMPINQTATEQRLVEELTGSPMQPHVPEHGEAVEPGDPLPDTDPEPVPDDQSI